MSRLRNPSTPTRRIDLALAPDLVVEVDVLAARRGCSRSVAVETLLRAALTGSNQGAAA